MTAMTGDRSVEVADRRGFAVPCEQFVCTNSTLPHTGYCSIVTALYSLIGAIFVNYA